MNAIVDNTINRFAEYTINSSKIWKDRMTWKGLYGDTPKNSINFQKFLREKDPFSDFPVAKDAMTFKQQADEIAKQYVQWVKDLAMTDNLSYTEEEYQNMFNCFIGAIGEYFFMEIFQMTKCIVARNIQTGALNRYDFNYVAPRLTNEIDYGVDLTAVMTHGSDTIPVAIQVKFWNPYTAGCELTNKIAQGVHSDAICNGFIDNAQKENIIICWLGDTRQVSKYLKANKKLYKHLVFIDSTALDNTINNQNSIFWIEFYKKLSNF